MIFKKIFVNTPKGLKFHGDIVVNAKSQHVFVRNVAKSKDLMRIFDAWSINPSCISELRKFAVVGIFYNDTETGMKYKLEFDRFEKMLSGEIRGDRNQKLAWEKEYSGGRTVYIKREAFEAYK